MALDNFSNIRQAAADWLNRSDLSSFLNDFVTIGENRIYRDLRARQMETSLTSTITGSGTISVPSDYIELKHAYIDENPATFLQRKQPEFIYEKYPSRTADGKPLFIAREGSSFIFGPFPSGTSTYVIRGIYWGRPTALSTSNETNFLTSNYPELLLYSTLLGAEAFLENDSRMATWESLYQKLVAQINKEIDDEKYSGSVPAAVASWR